MDYQKDDPVIARIREARHRISEECGHDPYKLVARYIEVQKHYKGQLLPPPDQPQPDKIEDHETELVEA